MKYLTALRGDARSRVEMIENVDLVVGIPSYNNQDTICNVIRQVSEGLHRYFPDKKSLIIVSDGGSVDDTREEADNAEVYPLQEKLVTIYRGIPGKGSAIRAVLEMARFLGSEACIMVDSDLRSIRPEWIRNLLQPIIEGGFHFVTPYYKRFKLDGTITNNIVYNMTRALYGKRVRQPIGGDFAMSREMVDHIYDQDVWDTDVGRFGIDIWMTTTALVGGFRICQARLGAKIHDVKDPSEHLGPMFRQVVATLFALQEKNAAFWMEVKGSVEVPIAGVEIETEPEPFPIDVAGLIRAFRQGYFQFGKLWEQILSEESFGAVRDLHEKGEEDFSLDVSSWARILYDAAVTYHCWEKYRFKLVELLTPLYYARVASFAKATEGMNDKEAEEEIEAQAGCFEEEKPYLIRRWNECEEVPRTF
jgi:glycosyltransferase involved in cell wall biosynthesis